MYRLAQRPGVSRENVCRLSTLLKGAARIGSNPMYICSNKFYSCVYSMPYVTSLILNPARVYPKAVAVVERYYQ